MHEVDLASGLLRDAVNFLENLRDADLSKSNETKRADLLCRMKIFLEKRAESPTAGEAYLDMNIGKSLTILATDEFEDADEGEDEDDDDDVENSPDNGQIYVGADVLPLVKVTQQQRGSVQNYYETFQDFSNVIACEVNSSNEADLKINDGTTDDLVLLYAGFSAAQAKDKSTKFGSLLHLRRERKMFAPFNVFWLNRSCWISLIGTHLLLYANERESRPYLVVPLRGYKCRPAPNAASRDPRRSEAAFEIYCPGDRTFQFAAETAREMRDWIDAVAASLEESNDRRSGDDNHLAEPSRCRVRAATFGELLQLDANERACIEKVKEDKEKYLVVKLKANDTPTSTKDDRKSCNYTSKLAKDEAAAPPLPARTHSNRRLPSLPTTPTATTTATAAIQDSQCCSIINLASSYEPRDDIYDEDSLYHRIEDVKAQPDYQNVDSARSSNFIKDASRSVTINDDDDEDQETYDDVAAFNESCVRDGFATIDNYDDVRDVRKSKNERSIFSDDSQRSATSDVRVIKSTDKATISKLDSSKDARSTQPLKRSFIDRMMNPAAAGVTSRKVESSKENRRVLVKPSTPPPPIPAAQLSNVNVKTRRRNSENRIELLTKYDDVLSRVQFGNDDSTNEEEYLSPPPPRPIYSRPPTTTTTTTSMMTKCANFDEIYDDIGSGDGKINGYRANSYCSNVDVIKQYPKNGSFLSDLQLSIDHEHYQVPKSSIRRVVVERPVEELYDDVALSETFKNRQRDQNVIVSSTSSPNNNNNNNSNNNNNNQKGVWGRFGSGKNKSSKIFDNVSSSNNNKQKNDTIDAVDGEKLMQQQPQTGSRVKPLLKLFNKMENTLSKVNGNKAHGVAQN